MKSLGDCVTSARRPACFPPATATKVPRTDVACTLVGVQGTKKGKKKGRAARGRLEDEEFTVVRTYVYKLTRREAAISSGLGSG